jgi:hypothetical protein
MLRIILTSGNKRWLAVTTNYQAVSAGKLEMLCSRKVFPRVESRKIQVVCAIHLFIHSTIRSPDFASRQCASLH